MTEALRITAADGTGLEAELALPHPVRAGAVLCHPHPLFGGTMRSIVIGALFAGLPAEGVACLRFNFRGVEGSDGRHTSGELEPLDAQAALDALDAAVPDGTPVVMAGWSFGADMALSVHDPRHAGWLAIAPPLRLLRHRKAVAADPRPKHLVLAQHDQVRSPAEIGAEVATWAATTTDVVAGADHFFIGRSERLVERALDFVSSVADGYRADRGETG